MTKGILLWTGSGDRKIGTCEVWEPFKSTTPSTWPSLSRRLLLIMPLIKIIRTPPSLPSNYNEKRSKRDNNSGSYEQHYNDDRTESLMTDTAEYTCILAYWWPKPALPLHTDRVAFGAYGWPHPPNEAYLEQLPILCGINITFLSSCTLRHCLETICLSDVLWNDSRFGTLALLEEEDEQGSQARAGRFLNKPLCWLDWVIFLLRFGIGVYALTCDLAFPIVFLWRWDIELKILKKNRGTLAEDRYLSSARSS